MTEYENNNMNDVSGGDKESAAAQNTEEIRAEQTGSADTAAAAANADNTDTGMNTGAAANAADTSAGTGPAVNTGANTGAYAGGTNPYSYRSGYYRNPNPHQDAPVQRTSYTGPQYASGAASSSNPGGRYTGYQTAGYTNQTGTENGYNYVNYYPNNNQAAVQTGKEKKKGSRKGLKIAACIAAVAVLVSASFAGGYFMNRGNNSSDGGQNIVTPGGQSSSEKENGSGEETIQKEDSAANGTTPSWLELAARSDSITIPEIVSKMTPSVVGISATFVVQTQNDYSGFGGFGGYFGFGNGGTQTQEAVGTGTGVIMSEDGYIITNAHVIYDSTSGYGAATSVEVQLSDQETVYPAEIVAYDVESDLAVLKVDQAGLTPAEFGNSDECQVGELVVAIGNPLGLELQNTVTCGIISAMNREITINDKEMTLIQTDTAINSGNSGGPLINSAGQVIGINSAKMSSSYSSSSATIEGIGFAIPITEAKEIVDDLITYGYVTGRPQLGITCQDVSEAVSQAYNIPVGAYVISVTEGGAADQAGIQIQDVIIAVDGQTITSTEELNDYKNEHDAGDQVILTIVRAGQQIDVPVTLQEAVVTAK